MGLLDELFTSKKPKKTGPRSQFFAAQAQVDSSSNTEPNPSSNVQRSIVRKTVRDSFPAARKSHNDDLQSAKPATKSPPPKTTIRNRSAVDRDLQLGRVSQVRSSRNSTETKPKKLQTIIRDSQLKIGNKEGNQDNLSRNSSVSNLDSLDPHSSSKGAKPKKASSKEKIDKVSHDVKKVLKNNNKIDTAIVSGTQPLAYSTDSLEGSSEFNQLKKQLQQMADEKSSLALALGEQRGHVNNLQLQIMKLKEESNQELQKLSEENDILRNRLRDVAHSPLSDNEKQQLLFFESRHPNSAPASIIPEDNGDNGTTCTTPDWDKQSSGNASEVSVACLQDKIQQMQETHYSTNEELQATLQELTDLQRQLTELQQENERLNEEKTLMFDSLCRQTERLNDSRQEVDNLKQLLYRDRTDETGVSQLESAVEREQKLMDLLRSAQEEREQLMIKLEQLQSEIHDTRSSYLEKTEQLGQLTERIKTLESTLDAKHAEHKQLDQELAQAKDQCSGRQIEINKLTDLLDNARTKINELESERILSDRSELEELLDNARKEKDQLESEIAYLKEQLARSKNEIDKLREQISVFQEEIKVVRNNAKTTQADLEYKFEKLLSEKNVLGEQLQQFQEAVNELQVQAQCHLEDKRQLSAVLSETQRNLSDAERKCLILEKELKELKQLRSEELAEWEKFQNDLLTSVRVANEFKTEAVEETQKIVIECKDLREANRLLQGQLDKLKGDKATSSTQTDIILTPQIVTLARNLDPNRLSLESCVNKDPLSPTSNMEKLFPILNRRTHSRDNLADLSTESDLSRKKSGLRKVKSKDDLTKCDPAPKGFFKWNKSLDNLDKPRKSEASVDSSDSNKSEPKSNDFLKFIKKRDKKNLNRVKSQSQHQFMSVEEETLLQSLNSWYENIDENLPNELLSEEDRAIRKLKSLYETDVGSKEKPKAHKPKEHLAISKPLLNSVVLNPKLKEIFGNPNLPTVDAVARQSALEENCSFVEDKAHVNVFEEDRTDSELPPVLYNRISDIQPNDSVSNPRYSVKYHNDLPKPNIYINYENLDEIVESIKTVPPNKLTEEQKFALKLKGALDESKASRKLKLNDISAPTRDSVERNWKLREILRNPSIKPAEEMRKRHSTSSLDMPRTSEAAANSKSYEDISFNFIADNTLLNLYYDRINSETSSSLSYNGGEFNLDTGKVVTKFDDRADEDLLYNETIKKDKKKVDPIDAHGSSKLKSQQSQDLEKNIEAVLERIKDLPPNTPAEAEQSVTSDHSNDDTKMKGIEQQRQSWRGSGMRENNKNKAQMLKLELDEQRNFMNSLLHKTEELTVQIKSATVIPVSEAEQVQLSRVKDECNILADELRDNCRIELETSISVKNNPEIESLVSNFVESEAPATLQKEDPTENENIEDKVEIVEHRTSFDDSFSFSQHEIDCSANANTEPPGGLVQHHQSSPNDYEDYSKTIWISQDSDDDLPTSNGDPQTTKENQYGVISPLNLRNTYRTVVREYKTKFTPETESPTIDNDSIDDFIDKFFAPINQDVDLRRSSENISQIDQDMNEILDKYLHTRASLLANQFDDPPESGLKKYDNFEDLQVIGDKSQKEEEEPLSLEDLQFIEEMKAKYGSTDTVSTSSELEKDVPIKPLRATRPLSEINDQDLQLIDSIKPKSPPSSLIPIRKDKTLPPSLRPKQRPTSQYNTNVSSNSQKRLSYQEGPTNSEPTTSRLSKLMFKETIFVPMSAPTTTTSPTYKQQSSFVENIVVSSEPVITARTSWTDSLKRNLLDAAPIDYEPGYPTDTRKHKPLPMPRKPSFRTDESDTKPKIIHWKPLESKIFEDKFPKRGAGLDTLERETTFQVLEKASKMRDSAPASTLDLEVEAWSGRKQTRRVLSSSQAHGSFLRAKQMFEQLADSTSGDRRVSKK